MTTIAIGVRVNSGGGGSGNNQPFAHLQPVPENVWIINHNLGYYPDVRVYSLLNQLVECDVEQVSVNQTKLNFSNPFAGSAYLL